MFQALLQNQTFLIIFSAVLAIAPAAIWLKILRSRKQTQERRDLERVFVWGFLSIIPVVGFQLITSCTPFEVFGFQVPLPCLPSRFNPLLFIESHHYNPTISSALVFSWFAALEEIGKLSIVKYVDFKGKKVLTINDALMFSITAALSFAFVENILYFRNILVGGSIATFFTVFVFRSIFTVAAHVIFSGIAGYYYGLAKFAKPIIGTTFWKKQELSIPKFFSKHLHTKPSTAYKAQLIIKGLLIATLAHAVFNFLLERHEVLWVVLLVIAGIFYIIHLIQRKSGALYLQLAKTRPSTMAPRDEEVVLELIGMWIEEEKYDEVIKICKRLLDRDPDNNVVKLFLAEAHHEKELQNAYKSIKALFTHKDVD